MLGGNRKFELPRVRVNYRGSTVFPLTTGNSVVSIRSRDIFLACEESPREKEGALE